MLTEMSDPLFKTLIFLAFVKETSEKIDDHEDLCLLI